MTTTTPTPAPSPSSADAPPSCRSPRCCHSPARVRIAARHLRSFAFICGRFLGTAFPETKPQMDANERKWKRPQTGRRRNACSDRSQRRHGARCHRPRRAASLLLPFASARSERCAASAFILVFICGWFLGTALPETKPQMDANERKWKRPQTGRRRNRCSDRSQRRHGARCHRPRRAAVPVAAIRQRAFGSLRGICVHLRSFAVGSSAPPFPRQNRK